MPRRSILCATERDNLLAIPAAGDELIRLYTFNEADLALIRQHRGAQNRLGFAVQLCYMRYPGVLLAVDALPSPSSLRMVSSQIKVPSEAWVAYGQREQTRREHIVELQTVLGLRTFTTLGHYRAAVHSLGELALQTDKGILLARALADSLRSKGVLLPTVDVMERICAEAITRANKRIYAALSDPLARAHRQRLDELLTHKARPRSSTKSSTCTTASSASCSTPPSTSMHNSSRLAARPSMTRCACTAVLVWR